MTKQLYLWMLFLFRFCYTTLLLWNWKISWINSFTFLSTITKFNLEKLISLNLDDVMALWKYIIDRYSVCSSYNSTSKGNDLVVSNYPICRWRLPLHFNTAIYNISNRCFSGRMNFRHSQCGFCKLWLTNTRGTIW